MMATERLQVVARPNQGDEARWRAVLARDPHADGVFVFAVRSTGIYCRPSCPARRPRRERVVFFPTPHRAEREGYRPCRRCRPQEARGRDPQADMVARACRYIETHVDDSLTLDAVGKEAGAAPDALRRAFQRILGLTPRRYAEACRLRLLKQRLKEGDTVTTALYTAGYGSSSRLYERAPAHLGMTPATYRNGGKGMRIHYAIVGSALGRLLVAGTERGICAVSLGASDGALKAALDQEYPQATITPDTGDLDRWAATLVAYLNGGRPHLDLPVDVQATAFQRRVWDALRTIPYGSTRTYSQVAREIGRPTAVRAVARACATNPTSLVVPCHRVVREDGGLGGYRWGIERKRQLLDMERRTVPTAEPAAPLSRARA